MESQQVTNGDFETGRLMTIRSVGSQLGLSESSIWLMIKKGKLGTVKLGHRTTRVTERSVQQLIKSGLEKTKQHNLPMSRSKDTSPEYHQYINLDELD